MKETCIDCHGVLITYPVAKRGEVEGFEVNLCVLGRCLLWVKEDKSARFRDHYERGARSLAESVSCMAYAIYHPKI